MKSLLKASVAAIILALISFAAFNVTKVRGVNINENSCFTDKDSLNLNGKSIFLVFDYFIFGGLFGCAFC